MRDADAVDFLGVVVEMRDVSKEPRGLHKACQSTKTRREKLRGWLCLEKAREIATGRVKQMDELLAQFEAESFGFF